MKAAYIEETGPPEVIQVGELPTPELESQQVLVRVSAVAVNPIDTYIRGGANYFPLPTPYIGRLRSGRDRRSDRIGRYPMFRRRSRLGIERGHFLAAGFFRRICRRR